jgi:two-component system chemotaxis response regulator CheY
MAKRYTLDELDDIQQKFEALFHSTERKFLLVDRQVTIRRTMMNALTAAGVEKDDILEAGDGMDAQMEASKCDCALVVLTDYKNKDGTADTLIDKIRSRPQGDRHKVILVTAEKNKKRLAPVLKAGVDGTIEKPFTPDAFAAHLRSLGVL